MAWIAVHEQLDGMKLRQLRKEAKCSKSEAIGILVQLWLWGINNAGPDGEIQGADRDDIADLYNNSISHKLTASAVVEALIKTGWVDEIGTRLFIHDWSTWQEQWYKALEKREKDRARKASAKSSSARNSTEFPANIHGNSRATVTVTKPSPLPLQEPSQNREKSECGSDEPPHSPATPENDSNIAIPQSDYGAVSLQEELADADDDGPNAPPPDDEGAPELPTLATPAKEKAPKHKYGEYGWVRLTDAEYDRLRTDLGDAELERCIAYLDESAQGNHNKNKWSDWNVMVRKCHRNGWGLNQQGARPAQARPSNGQAAMSDLQLLHQQYSEEGF